MYIHKQNKICWICPPKTASREITKVLKPRGFVQVGHHHEGPSFITERIHAFAKAGLFKHNTRPWSVPRPEYTYVTTIRNHFEAWLSYHFWFNRTNWTGENPERAMRPEHFEHIRERHKAYFLEPNLLWPYAHMDNVIVLRFENFREDLSKALKELGVSELQDFEFDNRQTYIDAGKEQLSKPSSGGWKYWNEESKAWVESMYGDEMGKLGYSFEQYKEWNS